MNPERIGQVGVAGVFVLCASAIFGTVKLQDLPYEVRRTASDHKFVADSFSPDCLSAQGGVRLRPLFDRIAVLKGYERCHESHPNPDAGYDIMTNLVKDLRSKDTQAHTFGVELSGPEGDTTVMIYSQNCAGKSAPLVLSGN